MLDIAILLQIIGFILGLIFGTTFITPTIERIFKLTEKKSLDLFNKWSKPLYKGKKIDIEWAYTALMYAVFFVLIIVGFFQQSGFLIPAGVTIIAVLIITMTIFITLFLEETKPGEKPKWHNPILWLKNLRFMTFFFIVYTPLFIAPLVLIALILKGVYISAKFSSNKNIRLILAVSGSITMLAGLIIEFIAI